MALLLANLGLLPASAQTPPAAAIADTALHRLAGGLRYRVLVLGTGATPLTGSQVAVRYVGHLPDGRVFDEIKPGQRPLRFRVGRGQVIPGWDALLPHLPAGSTVQVWVPAALAYGSKGVLDPVDGRRYVIPPDTELEFELELVQVR